MADILEVLTEEESYLSAILQDASGLDLAEFTWFDPNGPDGCFRAWPFQWSWWRDMSGRQIDQSARSVGKSLGVKVRGFAFPFLWPGSEMVITGPEGIHVDAITDLIETQVRSTRLSREMLAKGASGIKHKPFHMNFANGARIMGRIPQRDGKGVKGIHPVQLELDEAQDYPKNGWVELVETLKRGVSGAIWRAHGVTRGVRDKFYEYSQPNSGWKVHQITAMHRPNWSDEEREAKIREYGSREDPDYRRNVLGAHGDATNPIFVLHRLMRGVDTDESSDYNSEEYYRVDVKDTDLEHLQIDIVDYLEFPKRHQKYETVWIGMDVGFTADPSEILVFAEYHPSAAERKADEAAGRSVPVEGLSRMKVIARITLIRMSNPQQVRAIMAIIDFYKPRAFSMDKTGNGLPLFQDVQELIAKAADELGARRARLRAETIKGYGFSEKVLVDIDETVEMSEYADTDDTVRDAGINRNVLEHSTDVLRKLVDESRLMLPWDRDLIGEFQGQTYSYSKSTMDQYGRRRRIFSEGSFHALDAARMAAMGHAQDSIEEFVKKPKDSGPILDSFIAF